ncbi:uncharacterized protein LOC107274613 isoform X2 [Cephus cinctus]|uniref:Uncharacterized protein LOC107274613 isoform X2 n=1 Tax=Cephus cinctus TaxID=211228 RepID=A0AAJ7CF62_CEPCN|nr:uncharacterized protein LOC107274613 isoform X2 [Cephus cinctus]
MSLMLLQCVGDCFQRSEMHCLGAVTGGAASPNGVGNCGGVLGVVRALGVLVSEGRIQGPPRGYKEGPHCAAPMQAAPNKHVCEKDNYLCDRYLVLVREIAGRTAVGSLMCVEVLLCSDCPCGLAKATCKDPVFPIPSISIATWQHSSEMLLEYWCISVVPSKGPEMMNSQGLYQAVRSRLHFSQVAAWWSRSNGSKPNYVTTRVVPYSEDNLRKFRDSPTKHTFPLAGSGDGNSIKVTVWALPRMEEVPILTCPKHPIAGKDEEGVARALTPTKNMPVSTVSQNPETLLLPALVDDRLQTPCNEPGKHHCRCEEEDGCPPSPSLRPNGERKRRRSLPCGPEDVVPCPAYHTIPLPSVQEMSMRETNEIPTTNPDTANCDPSAVTLAQSQEQHTENHSNTESLVHCFRTQLSIEEQEGNVEKRYKRTVENLPATDASVMTQHREESLNYTDSLMWKRTNRDFEDSFEQNTDSVNIAPFDLSSSGSPAPYHDTVKVDTRKLRGFAEILNASRSTMPPPVPRETNLVINPFKERSPYHESNPGPSTYSGNTEFKNSIYSSCMVHQSCSKSSNNKTNTKDSTAESTRYHQTPKDLTRLMSKLSFPEDKEKPREEGGILEWFSKVPSRVLGVAASNGFMEERTKTNDVKTQEPRSSEVKFKNGNLELSQREFDEVLAVLRARTPSGRRRAPLKTVKRRDRSGRQGDDSSFYERSSVKSLTVNLESCKYASGYEANHATNSNSDDCDCKLCRKDQRLSGKSTWTQSSNWNEPAQLNQQDSYGSKEKLLDTNPTKKESLLAIKTDKLEGRTAKSADCFYNVSNKADVLLGAILRTSRDRKGLTDISNGTRPRRMLSAEKLEGSNDPQEQDRADKTNQTLRIVPYEDEKSLPLALNKRLNRFRQLFKREHERKDILTSESHSEDNFRNGDQRENSSNPDQNTSTSSVQKLLGQNHKSQRENRVKRRIDFSNFSEAVGKVNESSREIDGNSAHRNPRFHSTNSEDHIHPEMNSQNDIMITRVNLIRRQSTNPEEYYDHQEAQKSFATSSIANDVALASTQHSCSSSRIQSINNNRERVPSLVHEARNGWNIDENESFERGVPSAIEQERFRRSLENAASMVFHSRTGLPLTSSPAPLRRGSCCFDYDSSLNSVSSKRSALFELNTPPSPGAVSLEEADRETETAGEGEETPKRRSTSRGRPQSHALLGSFEESALNGRLEPVSTVHGFTAELGASGSFCPKHRKLPVTVFFYTLGDNDKVSTPYLAHINLSKKGYQVPRSGTIQVTLLNPLGTVVKMFVVLYDLSDMPPRSHTFLRQRTLRDKTLRYLVHLRFMSGKSGRIYLHTDIRMIICRKSDVDTASDFGSEPPKELRSYIHGPTNPKFSPRC